MFAAFTILKYAITKATTRSNPPDNLTILPTPLRTMSTSPATDPQTARRETTLKNRFVKGFTAFAL